MAHYFDTRYSYDRGRQKVWKAIVESLAAHFAGKETILELGAGYCDFINQIPARKKLALDHDATSAQHCAPEVTFLRASALQIPLPDGSVDAVFASNLLEHFDDGELGVVIGEIRRVLRRDGTLVLLQPNYFYCYREYWDDYTHKKAFTHSSLGDFLAAHGFTVTTTVPRFLPFSFKSALPRSYWLTKAYLMSPWRPQGKQMLVVADKRG